MAQSTTSNLFSPAHSSFHDVEVNGQDIREGRATRELETKTAQIPSVGFLAMAVGSMAVSATLMLMGRKQAANFVGQWAPSLLIIGVYNKLVKIESELGLVDSGV
jgi:hypothetical protein